MQVEEEEAVGARERDEVRDELRRDGLARLRLALLTRIAVIGHHGGDPAGRRAAQRVQDDEQLHQVLVHRRAGGLDHKHVVAPHRVLDLDVDLAVGEPPKAGVGERNLKHLGDALRQDRVRGAAQEFEGAPRGGLLPGVLNGCGQSANHCFLRITLAGTPTAVAPSGTSLVTTEPAPVRDPLPSLTGATSIVSTPTKAPSPISVRFLLTPSKLAVMVPAPMLASSPRSVSPR